MINKRIRCAATQVFVLVTGVTASAHAQTATAAPAESSSLMPVVVLGLGILLAVAGVAAIVLTRRGGRGQDVLASELATARTNLLNWSLQATNKDAVARVQSEGADEPRESREAESSYAEFRQVARRCALAGLTANARQLLELLPPPPDSKGWRKVRPNMPGAEKIAWAWFARGYAWKAVAETAASTDPSAANRAIECFTQAEAWFKDHMDPPVLLQKAELLASRPDRFVEMLDDVEEAWRRSQGNVKAQAFRAPAGVAYVEVMLQKYARDPQRGGDIFAAPSAPGPATVAAKTLSGAALRVRIEETMKSVVALLPAGTIGQAMVSVDAGLQARFHAAVAEFHQLNGKWVDATEACVAATGEPKPEGSLADIGMGSEPRVKDESIGLRGMNARRVARRVWVESLLQQSNHPSAAWLVIRFAKHGSMTLVERKRLAELILQQTQGAGDRSLSFETISRLRMAGELPIVSTGQEGGAPDPLARIRDLVLRGNITDAANDLLDQAQRSGSDSALAGMIAGIASDLLRHPAGFGLPLDVRVRLERLRPDTGGGQAAPRPLVRFKSVEQAGKVSAIAVRIAGDAFSAGQKLRVQLLNKDNLQVFGKGLLGSAGKLLDRELELKAAPATERPADGWTDTTNWLELGSGISLEGAADLGTEVRVRISHPFAAAPLDHAPISVKGTFTQAGPPTPAAGELLRSSYYISELLACVAAFVTRTGEASATAQGGLGMGDTPAWQGGSSFGLGVSLADRLVEALSRRLESEMDARDFAGCPNLKGGMLKNFVEQFQGVPVDVLKDVVAKCQASLSEIVRGALAQIMLDVTEIRDRKADLESKLGLKFQTVSASGPSSAGREDPKPTPVPKPIQGTLREMIGQFNADYVGAFPGVAAIDLSKVWESCEREKKLLWRLGADLRASRQLQEAERAQQAYWLACRISDQAPRNQ